MTSSILHTSSVSGYRLLAGALVVSALLMGNKVQAQDVDFYVSEVNPSTGTATLLGYNYNLGTDTLSTPDTFVLNGIRGLPETGTPSATEGGLQVSADGKMLSYAGYGLSAGSVEGLFNIAAGSLDTSTSSSSNIIRSSYYGTSNGGTNGFFVASGSNAPGFMAKGGTSVSTISNATSPGFSANAIAYNNITDNIYFTRNSSSSGVYTANTSGLGLFTSKATFVALTGDTTSLGNWTPSHVYTGLTFLGANNLFVADTNANTIDLFRSVDPTRTDKWDLTFALQLSSTETVQQLSVDQIDANNALLFFTTNGNGTAVTPGGTSTFDVVSFNTTTGFGTPEVLGNSSTEYFTGIAVVVPEPDTYVLFGLGLGLISFMMLRKKRKQGLSPS